VDANVGYAAQDYYNSQNWAVGSGVRTNNNGNVYGGFSGGLDAGYQINNNFGVELGWFYLPDVNVATGGLPATYLTSWVLYLAGKYMTPMPWMNNTNWFFKLGVDYRRAEVSTTAAVLGTATTLGISNGTSSYVRPMFATGFDYSFDEAWTGIIQYAYFMGANNSFPYTTANTGGFGTVAANVLTLGLGYKFMV